VATREFYSCSCSCSWSFLFLFLLLSFLVSFAGQASYLESMHLAYEEARASAEASIAIAQEGVANMIQVLEDYVEEVSR